MEHFQNEANSLVQEITTFLASKGEDLGDYVEKKQAWPTQFFTKWAKQIFSQKVYVDYRAIDVNSIAKSEFPPGFVPRGLEKLVVDATPCKGEDSTEFPENLPTPQA